MSESDRIEILTSVVTEAEAVMIITALNDAGIDARDEGALTAGMRAEAPGQVDVLVRGEDLERARVVLEQFLRSRHEIDWSQVDLGELED